MVMPPRNLKTAAVVCPACGHRFKLDERVLDHLRDDLRRSVRAGLKTQLREELSVELERKTKRLSAKELREKDEELRERERQIASLKRQVTSLSKKLPAGRAQALGDVRQETLAQRLAARCPQDEIAAVARGVRGADIIQRVRAPSGASCGTILWESKRAANWSNGWVRKLRDDQRRGNHAMAVIVSDALPDPDRSLVQVDGIWVADLEVAPDLAVLLRESVIEVAAARGARSRRDDLKGLAYDYLAGPEFAAHVLAIIENARRMRESLDAERRALQARWSERERQIEGVVGELAGIYGDLRGLGTGLPSIAQLELLPPDDQGLAAPDV
jgi:hypothetical protein